MGILDGLRGGIEKLEQKGDDALTRQRPLEAMRCFADALHKVSTKNPPAADRLQGKLKAARRSFLEAKLTEARGLAGDELFAQALETLEVAGQNLTPDDGDLRQRIAQLDQELREQLLEREAGAEAAPLALAQSATLPPDAVGHGTRAPAGDDEADPGSEAFSLDEASGEVAFEQFVGALPEEDRERALHTGREFKLGYVAHQIGDSAAAIAWLERAHAAAPEDGLVLEHLALALDQAGRTEEARESYVKTLALEPERHNARIALASILAGPRTAGGIQPFEVWRQAAAEAAHNGMDPQPALALLEEGLHRDAQHAGAYVMAAAEVCLATGRAEAAVAHVDRIIGQSGAQGALLWHLRAVGLELGGKIEEAQQAYEKAVRQGGHALFFRAEFAEYALRHQRALEEAEHHIFDTCMSCQATQPGAEELDFYGFLLTRLQHARGELQAALKGIDRLLAKAPPRELDQALRGLRRRVLAEIQAGQRLQDQDDAAQGDGDARE